MLCVDFAELHTLSTLGIFLSFFFFFSLNSPPFTSRMGSPLYSALWEHH